MTLLKRFPLVTFFVLAYLIAWSINAVQAGLLPFQLPEPVSDFLVNWSPGFAALIVVATLNGWKGIGNLLRPLLAWRVSPSWYTMALFLTPVLVLAAIGIALLFGGPMPQFGQTLSPHLALLPILLFFNLGEEIGWRGFALPRLQIGMRALRASLVLGVIWGVWHAPKFFLGGQGASALLVFLVFLISVIAQTILMTWLYNNSGGSLLLVTLFHFSSDAVLTFFLPVWISPAGVPLVFALVTMLQVALAVLVIVRYGAARLSLQRMTATSGIVEPARASIS